MNRTPAWRALILAAGRGSRLGSLTHDRPKCLLTLGGRTLLDWQRAALRDAGVGRVAVVAGYRAELVRRMGLPCFENRAWACSNMVASLLAARDWLAAGPCIVSYGDIVYHPRIVRALLACPQDVAIVYDRAWRRLWAERFEHPEEDAESLRVRDGLVEDIGRRGIDLDRVEGQFLGLVRFSPAGWSHVERWLGGIEEATRRRIDTTTLLRELVGAGMPVGAAPVRGGWCEVDCERDLALYQARIDATEDWLHDWRF